MGNINGNVLAQKNAKKGKRPDFQALGKRTSPFFQKGTGSGIQLFTSCLLNVVVLLLVAVSKILLCGSETTPISGSGCETPV